MPCTPPFYPSPGHQSRDCHDRSAQCAYYAVWRGWVRGGFTNSWIARNQTEGFSDSQQKSFKKWDDLIAWWTARCTEEHGNQCPAFESLSFSLTPGPYAPPAGPGCTRVAATSAPSASSSSAPAASTSSASSSSSSSSTPTTPRPAPAAAAASPTPTPTPTPTPGATESSHGGYGGITAASFHWAARHTQAQGAAAPASAPTAAPSPFNVSRHPKTEPLSPSPKKEEPPHLAAPRVTTSTRVQLTPVGRAHAEALARRDLSPSPSPSPTLLATPAHARRTPTTPAPSILSTPAGPSVAAVAPAPVPTRVRMYGVRGVGVFYDSYASARAASMRLGLEDSKIMVTDNVDKLEAWITGKPFVGEDS